MTQMIIKVNEFFFTKMEDVRCCDEWQFVAYCYKHENKFGCAFCEYDYSKECECE
jgi:hypothetical protein